jgi:zinc-ribbon domain
MMKRCILLILIIFLLSPMATGYAQTRVTSLDVLVVDLWPDYDRASVLFLLTGSLPANTKFPASVTLPFPETARLNAIARVDGSDGIMKDDILSSPAPGEISFITPDVRFRLEYYFPYAADNLKRTFDFAWLADIHVEHFQLNIQQPKFASALTTDPIAENIGIGGNGFVFHTFATRPVPAGQPLSVHVNYTMTSRQLSAEIKPPQASDQQTGGPPVASTNGSGLNWALVMGGLIVFAALAWQLASQRSSDKVPTPSKAKVEKQSRNKFCQDCGKPVDEDDTFCGECGRKL